MESGPTRKDEYSNNRPSKISQTVGGGQNVLEKGRNKAKEYLQKPKYEIRETRLRRTSRNRKKQTNS